MFIHQNQLEHRLTPVHYISPEQHQLEVERIFLPGWQCVATVLEKCYGARTKDANEKIARSHN